MLSTDRKEFDLHLAVLFGGWPNNMLSDERKEAYWRGLQTMQLSSFARCVDRALGEHGPDKLPTANGIWNIYREMRATSRGGVATTEVSVQVKLIKFVKQHRQLTKWQRSAPWSYIHRKDQSGALGDVIGVLIPSDGEIPGLRVMVEDLIAEQAA